MTPTLTPAYPRRKPDLLETTLDNSQTAESVHDRLDRWILADGMPMVVDLDKSKGASLHDARTGKDFLDFFGCFGSTPIGWNHPRLRSDAFLQKAAGALANRPSNSDLYSGEMATFVQAFGEKAVPEGWKHLFFIDGGALAVENALKVAFDWKVRKNQAAGIDGEVGSRVIHFEHAFHGRSGYTLSLTNTLPDKILNFPKFEDWPCIQSPALSFPLTDEVLAEVQEAEDETLASLDRILSEQGPEIAALILEPIQCEGGDRYFRTEFLTALQGKCRSADVLFILDEVQTGFFSTGKPWCFQHHGLEPDIVAFGKKTQQCGIFVGPRVEEVDDHCFAMSSRINSTWGGNLVDMIRATEILSVVEDEGLEANAAAQGARWLEGMASIANNHDQVSNVRGLGLILAFDMPDGDARGAFLKTAEEKGLLGLGCGSRSVRFRPHLAVTADEVDRCLAVTEDVLSSS